MAYRIDPDDAGQPNLELYVHHSMMDDFHARIWADGFVEELAAMRLWVQFDPCVPTSRDDALVETRASNGTIAAQLEERGLLPDDIHPATRPDASV